MINVVRDFCGMRPNLESVLSQKQNIAPCCTRTGHSSKIYDDDDDDGDGDDDDDDDDEEQFRVVAVASSDSCFASAYNFITFENRLKRLAR